MKPGQARICLFAAVAALAVAAVAQQPRGRAAQPSASGVPSRSLLGELDKAEVGASATVRTAQGSGPGMVLASSGEVLASLHLVLDDKKQVAPHISVDVSTPPQKPLTDIPATVAAQDPADDLVLLKLGWAVPHAQAAAPAAALPAITPIRTGRPRRKMGVGGTPVPSAKSEVAVPVAPQPSPEQPPSSPKPAPKKAPQGPAPKAQKADGVTTRIIYDGPADG